MHTLLYIYIYIYSEREREKEKRERERARERERERERESERASERASEREIQIVQAAAFECSLPLPVTFSTIVKWGAYKLCSMSCISSRHPPPEQAEGAATRAGAPQQRTCAGDAHREGEGGDAHRHFVEGLGYFVGGLHQQSRIASQCAELGGGGTGQGEGGFGIGGGGGEEEDGFVPGEVDMYT